jgi:transposase
MSVGNDGDLAPGVRRRRSWTRDEKRRIVDESLEDGASIAEVARRHELNANLLFTWRRKLGVERSGRNAPMGIVPVTIAPELAAEGHCPDAAGQMEIVLSEGDRIIVWADVETAALTRVLKALSGR